jgi:hypothetical protein
VPIPGRINPPLRLLLRNVARRDGALFGIAVSPTHGEADAAPGERLGGRQVSVAHRPDGDPAAHDRFQPEGPMTCLRRRA